MAKFLSPAKGDHEVAFFTSFAKSYFSFASSISTL